MARKKDQPCAVCGRLMWRGRGVLPAGKATCQPCRRALRTPTTKADRARQRYAEEHGPIQDRHCDHCGATFTPRARTGVRFCSPVCRTSSPEHRARVAQKNAARRASKAGTAAEQVDQRQVYDRDGWRCGICHGHISKTRAWPHPKSPSIDHIIPLNAGGTHTLANVQASHLGCNSGKRDRALAQGEQLRLVG